MIEKIFNVVESDIYSINESNEVKISVSRILVVISIIILIFFVISFRILEISLFSNKGEYSSNYDELESVPVLKSRPNILDRNENIIAVNLNTASLFANPKKISDAKLVVKKLKKIIKIDDDKGLLKRLESKKNFIWIKRNLTPKEQFEINKMGIPGIYFKNEERRIYPQNNLFSHILGTVNIDGKGISGIERFFENEFIKNEDSSKIDQNLELSIDMRVQQIVRSELASAMKEFKALGSAAIVMDANSFEVISMVSLPDFDLNNVSKANKDQKFNRASYGLYEMGSTFKIFNMAMGYEIGGLKDDDLFDLSEPLKVARFSIRDYRPKKKIMNASEVFMYSSNIGSADIALNTGIDKQKKFLKDLGLLDKLNFEITEKSRPLYPEKWGKVSSVTISYGHGIAVTPMHVVTSTASMINGGILKNPTLLKKTNNKDVGKRVISKKTSDKIRKIMRLAVKHGTGSKSDVNGYLVGGKTGSADKPKKGRYNTKVNVASFVAAFPMHKPEYVILVMVDEPKGNKRTHGFTTGGVIAAPIVGDIIEKIAPILNVPPIDEDNYFIRKEFWYEPDEERKSASFARNYSN